MAKHITIALTLLIFALFLWAMVAGPGDWDASAAYTDTVEAGHGLVDVVPHFAGLEAGISSESIHFVNEYGDCGWEVNECWLTDFIGGVPALPNALLDGAVHNDTVASAVNVGDVIVGAAGGWDDIPIGAAGDIATVVAGTFAWQAPAASAWVQIAEAAVVVAGADYTVRGGGAVVGAVEDVVVLVTCRSTANSGVAWSAWSSFTPVASMVTYYWVLDGANNLQVHIVNDSAIDILATVQYNEL